MDFLPTKGFEYLLVIGYLLLLIPFYKLAFPGSAGVGAAARTALGLAPAAAMRSWFSVPEGIHFHRGHTWAVAEGGGVFRVGIDEFAERMLGAPAAVELPQVGDWIRQGEPAPRLRMNGHAVTLRAPVGGEVVAVNHDVLAQPALTSNDPYGTGWLMKVRAPHPDAALSNLLSGRVARAWMDDASERLSALMGPALGPVLQDGGVPVPGFARELAPDDWPRLAQELLLAE